MVISVAYGSQLSLLRALQVVQLPDSANPARIPQQRSSSEVLVSDVTSWVVMSLPDGGRGFPEDSLLLHTWTGLASPCLRQYYSSSETLLIK